MMLNLIMLAMLGCASNSKQLPEAYPLEKDLYDWSCKDYQDVTEIEITTWSCDDSIVYIAAEVHLVEGPVWKSKMDYGDDCLYETFVPLYDDYCIEVEGVTVVAWAQ